MGNAYFSFGTFSTTIQPNVRYGITLSASLKGMMMDIDRLSAMRVNTDNNRQVWVAFNAAQGARHSANEHLIPESLFNDPNAITKNVHGISAVKALQIAASQGQKIYRIDQSNISTVIPQLQHKTIIIEDIQNAVAAGKIVTISQKAITQNGWTGVGYSIIDPSTGAGAYLIGGAADGGILLILINLIIFALSIFATFSVLAASPLIAVVGLALLIKGFFDFLDLGKELSEMKDIDAANKKLIDYTKWATFFFATGFFLGWIHKDEDHVDLFVLIVNDLALGFLADIF